MLKLSFAYSIPVFLAGIGILQAAAAYNNLSGLLFFPKKLLSYSFAAVMIGMALVILSTWNLHFEIGIIEGAQQAGLFFLSMVIALLFTVCLSSLLNRKRFSRVNEILNGLEALRSNTFFQVLEQQFRKRK
jgi:hypothetical protein